MKCAHGAVLLYHKVFWVDVRNIQNFNLQATGICEDSKRHKIPLDLDGHFE